MIGKLAHVRSRRDVLIASLVITGVSVACAVVLTACVTRSAKSAVDFSALRNAAEIAAVIAFVISFLVVDAIRRILKGKRSIERLAMTDDLTGLSNRRALLAAAERAIARIDGVALPPALLIVDLDHFKRVNDVYGHRAGDQALQAAAQALARSVRGDVDFVGRLGGEEFVVLLAAADEETARRAAESAQGGDRGDARGDAQRRNRRHRQHRLHAARRRGLRFDGAAARRRGALRRQAGGAQSDRFARAERRRTPCRRRSRAGCAATRRSGCVDRRKPPRQRAPAAAASARHQAALAAQFQLAAGDGDGSSQTRVAPIVSCCSPKPASRRR